MRRAVFLALTIWLVAAPAVAAPKKPAAVPPIMQNCDAHKFETIVDATVAGQPRKSKVKLCGVEGQSDADWISTLRDAIRKLEANKEMATAVRDQIVTAINAEIARVKIEGSALGSKAATPQGPPAQPLSRDYSALPPLPPPRETPVARIDKGFAVLPPLPAAPPAPTQSQVAAIAVPASAVIAPHLSINCSTPGDLAGDAPCSGFERETILTIRTKDDVASGFLLQFVRNGSAEGDIPLDGLRRNATLRTALPAQLCRGFTNGKLELQIVRGGSSDGTEVLSSQGPYSLRC